MGIDCHIGQCNCRLCVYLCWGGNRDITDNTQKGNIQKNKVISENIECLEGKDSELTGCWEGDPVILAQLI